MKLFFVNTQKKNLLTKINMSHLLCFMLCSKISKRLDSGDIIACMLNPILFCIYYMYALSCSKY